MNDLITFTKSVSTKFVESGIFGKEGEILKSKDSFSFQFSSSENEKLTIRQAVDNQISTFNINKCLDLLRQKYNIKTFKISKIDFSSNLDLVQLSNITNGDTVSIQIFNSESNQLLNKSLCEKEPSENNIPCTPISTDIKAIKNELNNYKIIGRGLGEIDLSNKDDPIFNDRCIKLKNQKGAILTVNERRAKLFPNNTISCVALNPNETCVYAGLDANYYSICKCTGIQEAKNLFEKAILESISDININIVLCYIQVLIFVYY